MSRKLFDEVRSSSESQQNGAENLLRADEEVKDSGSKTAGVDISK